MALDQHARRRAQPPEHRRDPEELDRPPDQRRRDQHTERQAGRASVWSLDPDGEKAEKRSIRIGDLSRDGHVEVVEGLRPGDPIILNPPGDLVSGERVRASPTIEGDKS